jgi:hypothetical protein
VAETGAEGDEQAVDIVVISDGGIPPGTLPPLPGRLKYLSIGKDRRNLAVRALAPRPVGSGIELFASVANYGDQVGSALLSIYRDGALIDSQALSIPPGKSRDIILVDLSHTLTDAGPGSKPALSVGDGSGRILFPWMTRLRGLSPVA